MKILKRLGITLLVLIALAVTAFSAYGIGKDVVAAIPSWLTEFSVGIVIIGIVIMGVAVIAVIVFTLGIIKIKEWVKED